MSSFVLFSAIFLSKFEKLSRTNEWCAWNSNGFSCLPLSFYTEKKEVLVWCFVCFFYSAHTSPILSIHFWPIWHNMLFHLRKKKKDDEKELWYLLFKYAKKFGSSFFPILILRTEWYRKHALQVHKAQTNNTLDPFPLILPMQHTWLHRTRYTWY